MLTRYRKWAFQGIALVLILAWLLSGVSAAEQGAAQNSGQYFGTAANQVFVEEVHVNPLYKDSVTEAQLKEMLDAVERDDDSATLQSDVYLTEVEAAQVLRDGMKDRQGTVQLNVQFPLTGSNVEDLKAVANANANRLWETALEHTGSPVEGDYLAYQYAGSGWSYRYWSDGTNCYLLDMEFTIAYYTDAEQEAVMDARIPEVLSSLNLDGKNDYEKTKAIYDYICANVDYDYTHLSDTSYKLMFTAYAALINRTAVCQGYANLFYRMTLTAGVDSRIVTGIGNGGPHAWNIVEIGGRYYNLDSTWDANEKSYSYFLLSDRNFYTDDTTQVNGHTREDQFLTEEFYADYPMSYVNYGEGKDLHCSTVGAYQEGYTFSAVDAEDFTALVLNKETTDSAEMKTIWAYVEEMDSTGRPVQFYQIPGRWKYDCYDFSVKTPNGPYKMFLIDESLQPVMEAVSGT